MLLINIGGIWLGNIVLEEYFWEFYMFDSVGVFNALFEWGHFDLVEQGFRVLDWFYLGVVQNIVDVEVYFDLESEEEVALLFTFLMYDGWVGLYVINYFLLYFE